MVSLVFVPLDATVALVAGLVAAAAILVSLVLLSPWWRCATASSAWGAHIPVALLGDPEAFTGDEARHLRGPGLSGTAWHMLRGDRRVVVVPVRDERDPVTVWVFSTRTPDRVVYAIGRARRG